MDTQTSASQQDNLTKMEEANEPAQTFDYLDSHPQQPKSTVTGEELQNVPSRLTVDSDTGSDILDNSQQRSNSPSTVPTTSTRQARPQHSIQIRTAINVPQAAPFKPKYPPHKYWRYRTQIPIPPVPTDEIVKLPPSRIPRLQPVARPSNRQSKVTTRTGGIKRKHLLYESTCSSNKKCKR